MRAAREDTFGFNRAAIRQSTHEQEDLVITHHTPVRGRALARAAHLMKLRFCISPAEELIPGFVHNVTLIVCILARRLHIAGDDDLVRMMLASSCWSLATRRTRRLHGAKMSVIGMSHIPNTSISISARLLNFPGFTSPDCFDLCCPLQACLHI